MAWNWPSETAGREGREGFAKTAKEQPKRWFFDSFAFFAKFLRPSRPDVRISGF
jgi:hypothetical protein